MQSHPAEEKGRKKIHGEDKTRKRKKKRELYSLIWRRVRHEMGF
jgi:hypothetical protein